MDTSSKTEPNRWQPLSLAIFGLMVLATVAFAAASLIHFGIVITLGPLTVDDPFRGAALPESIIAVVLGISALSVLTRWPARWGIALAATMFALLLTVYGLSVTLRSARTGDIVYHVAVLVLLLVIVILLLMLPSVRAALGRGAAGARTISRDC